MYSVVKYLTKSVFVILLCLLLITLIGFFASLQSTPKVTSSATLDNYSAQQSQQLASRLWHDLNQVNTDISLRLTANELQGLTALLHRAVPIVNANVQLSNLGGMFTATLTLPLPEFIKFLNVQLLVLPSHHGLEIEQVSIGRLTFSGDWLVKSMQWLLNTFVQAELGDNLFEMISAVDISANEIVINAHINNQLSDLKQQGSILRKLRDELSLFGDTQNIHCYFNALNLYAQQQDANSSIALYVSYVFRLAKWGCLADNKQTAQQENQAALLALVLYFGANKFQLLVTDVLNIPERERVVRNRLRSNVTLQGRVDLQKHFIYSAALQLLSSYQASDAIGEFKEFLDTNSGGTGFSFVDLMADRAGTRLAMIVTHSDQQALQAQDLLMDIKDQQLLPDINGLDEGLRVNVFQEQYKNVNSPEYITALKNIDERLQSLAIYQLAWH